MIKKTLYFGNAAYLSLKNKQLVVRTKEDDEEKENTVPVEDIGTVILDSYQCTVTTNLLAELHGNNTAVIVCDNKHMPAGMLLPLESNDVQQERFEAQIAASEPLKKQLWAQTIKEKITNQAHLLKKLGKPITNMLRWAAKVRSGDPDNYEARAAKYYWQNFFPFIEFKRERTGDAPNQLLNYGYAVLRAIVARSIAGAGLLPALGIHHQNRYNAFCLADDIMEPYRPFVDNIVWQIVRNGEDFYELTPSIKKQLLSIPVADVGIGGTKSPLMIASQRTASSLADCYAGKKRKINYPYFHDIF